jgi:hypothetical protein
MLDCIVFLTRTNKLRNEGVTMSLAGAVKNVGANVALRQAESLHKLSRQSAASEKTKLGFMAKKFGSSIEMTLKSFMKLQIVNPWEGRRALHFQKVKRLRWCRGTMKACILRTIRPIKDMSETTKRS